MEGATAASARCAFVRRSLGPHRACQYARPDDARTRQTLAAIATSDPARILAALAQVEAPDDDLLLEIACLFDEPAFEARRRRDELFGAVRRLLWATRGDAPLWSRDAAWMALDPFVPCDPQFVSDLTGAVLLQTPTHDRALDVYTRVAVVHEYLHRGTDLSCVARAAIDPPRRAELLAYDACVWELVTGEPDHPHAQRLIAEARSADAAVDVEAIRARCAGFRPSG